MPNIAEAVVIAGRAENAARPAQVRGERESRKARYARFKQAGICVHCEEAAANKPRVLCADCNKTHSERGAARWAKMALKVARSKPKRLCSGCQVELRRRAHNPCRLCRAVERAEMRRVRDIDFLREPDMPKDAECKTCATLPSGKAHSCPAVYWLLDEPVCVDCFKGHNHAFRVNVEAA